MRPFFDWLIVALILCLAAVCAFHNTEAEELLPRLAPVVDDGPQLAPAFSSAPVVVPDTGPPLTRPHESWCEPIDLFPCSTASDCPRTPDGSAMSCVRPWWREAATEGERVCVVGFPTRDVQEWRAARLRVLVDEICKRSDGCDPEALHDYLAVLALRESTWRPYKAHRLEADLDANRRAWLRYANRYVDSPAAGDPARWAAGRGLYGQNPAALLHVWDASEIPEALCGEVEATLVHLRTARDRWRRLERGVICGGREHHGTGGGKPSWYDLSLVNSGSEACPATSGRALTVREGFVDRAHARGLNPYGAVTLRMLGRPVSRDEQTKFSSDVRRKMDAIPRP